MQVNSQILEKMFKIMDKNNCKMVTYDQFYDFLKFEEPEINIINFIEKPIKPQINV